MTYLEIFEAIIILSILFYSIKLRFGNRPKPEEETEVLHKQNRRLSSLLFERTGELENLRNIINSNNYLIPNDFETIDRTLLDANRDLLPTGIVIYYDLNKDFYTHKEMVKTFETKLSERLKQEDQANNGLKALYRNDYPHSMRELDF